MSDLAEFLLARIAEDEHFGTHDRHLAKRWDAECEAKRRIVKRHERAAALIGRHPSAEAAEGTLRGVLQDLAAVYADHPDYRDEWRP